MPVVSPDGRIGENGDSKKDALLPMAKHKCIIWQDLDLTGREPVLS